MFAFVCRQDKGSARLVDTGQMGLVHYTCKRTGSMPQGMGEGFRLSRGQDTGLKVYSKTCEAFLKGKRINNPRITNDLSLPCFISVDYQKNNLGHGFLHPCYPPSPHPLRGSPPLKVLTVRGFRQIMVDLHFCSDNCERIDSSVGSTVEAHGTMPIVCETAPPFLLKDLLPIT